MTPCGVFFRKAGGNRGVRMPTILRKRATLAPFIEAGYTFYTIDPSDYVDNEAQTDSLETLRVKADQLPWDSLGTDYGSMKAQYCARPIVLDDLTLVFDEETFLRALVKYGRAILHTTEIAAAAR